MPNYILDLRKLVGSRPLIMTAAGVLLVDGSGRVLLQKRSDNGCWGIPGGSMELGETFEMTARREVYEETGLEVGDLQFFSLHAGTGAHYVFPHGDEVYIAAAIFICRDFRGQEHVHDSESFALGWFTADDLPDEVNPPDRPVLARFVEWSRGI